MKLHLNDIIIYSEQEHGFEYDISPAVWNSYQSALLALIAATKQLEKELSK